MKMKRIVSLTALLSLFVVILTSVILYIVPQGRVAYWANWQLWGLSKEQWSAVHINVGILFVIALLFHTYYNWENIELYLRDKSRKMKIFTKDFNMALCLIVVFVVGAYIQVPPFSTIMEINSQIKEAAAEKYGDPPYGHAELSSLQSFARHIGVDLHAAKKYLLEKGYTVESDKQSLKQIAIANGVSPQQIYLAMSMSSANAGEVKRLPVKPGQGMGNLTLQELCRSYGLDSRTLITSLKDKNISCREEMTMKQIGELNGLRPMEIYREIQKIVENEDMN